MKLPCLGSVVIGHKSDGEWPELLSVAKKKKRERESL